MSNESVPESVRVDNVLVQPGEMASGPSEFDPGYYGWRVVLAACLGVMAGFGSLFVYTFSVFVKPLAAEFGRSREAISSGFAIAAVTLGLVSPPLGQWIDRLGPRRIHHHPIWLASRLWITRRSGLAARLAPELALHSRTQLRREKVSYHYSFRNDMATRLTLFFLLDYHRYPFREFDQHEWGNHSSLGVAN